MAGTPSSSSSYDTAADHIVEGLLCPDSIDAMRKWAVRLACRMHICCLVQGTENVEADSCCQHGAEL